MEVSMQRISELSISHPRLTTALIALLVGVTLIGANYIEYEQDVRAIFSEDDPQRLALESLEAEFGRPHGAIFAIETTEGTLFSQSGFKLLEELTEVAWTMPYTTRVESLANFQHSWSEHDELMVRSVIDNAAAMTQQDIDSARIISLNEPAIKDRLISKDGRVASINLTFSFSDNKTVEETQVVAALRELEQQVETENPNINVYIVGNSIASVVGFTVNKDDLTILSSVMFVLMMVLLVYLLRSISAMLSILVVVIFADLIAIGLTGWLGIEITILSSMFSHTIITIGIAQCVHVLVKFFQLYGETGKDKITAIRTALEINLKPIFFTSLTTIIGLLSLNFSNLSAIRTMGNISAIGVVAVFLLTYSLLPALLAMLPVNNQKPNSAVDKLMTAWASLIVNNPLRVFLLTLSVSILCAVAIPNNVISHSYLEMFTENHPHRQDNQFVDRNIGGLSTLEYELVAGKDTGSISEPEFLANLDKFTLWLRQQPEVKHIFSYSDIIKRLNKNLHNDAEGFYRVPETRELAAQYLLLYEMSLPQGLDLGQQINRDRNATRLVITFATLDSRALQTLQAKIDHWMQNNLPQSMYHPGASTSAMFAHAVNLAVTSGVLGAVLALMLISLLLVIALRSFTYGLLSLVPNIFPVVIAFGVWGLTYGELGIGVGLSIGVPIGIIVDDTVHFLMRYLRIKREEKVSAEQALMATFTSVGPAIFITSMTILIGFSVMIFATYQAMVDAHMLMVLIVAAALLLDFLLLPAILLIFERARQHKLVKAGAHSFHANSIKSRNHGLQEPAVD